MAKKDLTQIPTNISTTPKSEDFNLTVSRSPEIGKILERYEGNNCVQLVNTLSKIDVWNTSRNDLTYIVQEKLSIALNEARIVANEIGDVARNFRYNIKKPS